MKLPEGMGDLEVPENEIKGQGSIIYVCEWCNEPFRGYPSRAKAKHICCSKECMSNLIKERTKQNHVPNAICPICNKEFWVKPSQLSKYNKVCCSKECSLVLTKERMTGTGNHQYGLKGKLNPTWKSDEKISNYGYKMIRLPNHPFANCDGFVFEHRMVAEKYLLTPENSIIIDDKIYLSPEFEVHHIDENKLNNDVNNLIVLTKSQHKKLHCQQSPQPRDKKTGRFVSKKGDNIGSTGK